MNLNHYLGILITDIDGAKKYSDVGRKSFVQIINNNYSQSVKTIIVLCSLENIRPKSMKLAEHSHHHSCSCTRLI